MTPPGGVGTEGPEGGPEGEGEGGPEGEGAPGALEPPPGEAGPGEPAALAPFQAPLAPALA